MSPGTTPTSITTMFDFSKSPTKAHSLTVYSGLGWLNVQQIPNHCCGAVFGCAESTCLSLCLLFSVGNDWVKIKKKHLYHNLWTGFHWFPFYFLVASSNLFSWPRCFLSDLFGERLQVLSLLVAVASVCFACYVFFVPGAAGPCASQRAWFPWLEILYSQCHPVYKSFEKWLCKIYILFFLSPDPVTIVSHNFEDLRKKITQRHPGYPPAKAATRPPVGSSQTWGSLWCVILRYFQHPSIQCSRRKNLNVARSHRNMMKYDLFLALKIHGKKKRTFSFELLLVGRS